MSKLWPSLSLALASLFVSNGARAHIELIEPPPRYADARAENKSCPCGFGTSNRVCDVEAERSDPNRSNRVTTLTAGQRLVVRFDEYIAHSGRFRVAFDPDGADLGDFNAHPLADIQDPLGNTGNAGEGSIWEIEVTVPDTPCTNCTLQLIQVMESDLMMTPIDDPAPHSTYYACADIQIVAGAAAGSGGSGAESPDAGTGDTPASEDGGGCSLRPAAPSTIPVLLGALALVTVAGLRRRGLAG